MFSYIRKLCLINIYPKKQLKLENFQEFRFVIDDTYNNILNGNIWLLYFDKNKQIDIINQINNMYKNQIRKRLDIEKLLINQLLIFHI